MSPIPTASSNDASSYEYELPPELIAQHPSPRRGDSNLLVLQRETGTIRHEKFRHVCKLLHDGDVLVLNRTRVMRARLLGRRATGGRVEALLIRQAARPNEWWTMMRPGARLRTGERVWFEDGSVEAELLERSHTGEWLVRWYTPQALPDLLEEIGRVPLPPYIHRAHDQQRLPDDLERYQTVYATEPGSVAAPTAGLHFTNEMLEALETAGVELVYLTLHVGPGTFRPVKHNDVRLHQVEPEYFQVGRRTSRKLLAARRDSRRVVAVGTTVCRALESLALQGQLGQPMSGWTDLFIHPPYEFRVVDVLITNFHLPRSTLLMLVCAFARRDLIMNSYSEAVERNYRFYSYGDAMIIV